jgi:hypothetical protein
MQQMDCRQRCFTQAEGVKVIHKTEQAAVVDQELPPKQTACSNYTQKTCTPVSKQHAACNSGLRY